MEANLILPALVAIGGIALVLYQNSCTLVLLRKTYCPRCGSLMERPQRNGFDYRTGKPIKIPLHYKVCPKGCDHDCVEDLCKICGNYF